MINSWLEWIADLPIRSSISVTDRAAATKSPGKLVPHRIWTMKLRAISAGVPGLEPRMAEPESAVLPITPYPNDLGFRLHHWLRWHRRSGREREYQTVPGKLQIAWSRRHIRCVTVPRRRPPRAGVWTDAVPGGAGDGVVTPGSVGGRGPFAAGAQSLHGELAAQQFHGFVQRRTDM